MSTNSHFFELLIEDFSDRSIDTQGGIEDLPASCKGTEECASYIEDRIPQHCSQ